MDSFLYQNHKDLLTFFLMQWIMFQIIIRWINISCVYNRYDECGDEKEAQILLASLYTEKNMERFTDYIWVAFHTAQISSLLYILILDYSPEQWSFITSGFIVVLFILGRNITDFIYDHFYNTILFEIFAPRIIGAKGITKSIDYYPYQIASNLNLSFIKLPYKINADARKRIMRIVFCIISTNTLLFYPKTGTILFFLAIGQYFPCGSKISEILQDIRAVNHSDFIIQILKTIFVITLSSAVIVKILNHVLLLFIDGWSGYTIGTQLAISSTLSAIITAILVDKDKLYKG